MSGDTPPVRQQLRRIGESIREAYLRNRSVLSFTEYLEAVAQKPHLHLRSAPQYVKGAFDYFGTETVEYPWGEQRRFKLFDCGWADGRDQLVGHEEVQNLVYRALENFVHEGTSNKLILLHGPNGSAKSTLVRAIGRGLQNYSTTEEGALYRINWIFPARKTTRGDIGFGGGAEDTNPSESFARLPDELVDAKLTDELRDHPLLLVPADERRRMMHEMLDAHESDHEFVVSDYLHYGRLSPRNRTVYESLLASYQGDYAKVLRHVQVERFYIQHRYREGYVTVEPQLAVDASERQLTADRSITALPSALQSVSLYDYGGEVVNANRGLIEYSDLLKRPLEAYKYLLTTVERASIALPTATLFLDLVFVGTSNEIHLNAFKEIPEFQSFRGRLELVRVPYLLSATREQQIYAERIREAAGTRHVAPHCAYVAALWAVLTRMRKPQADRYPKEVADLVARLTPLEKADLYASGRMPASLSGKQARDLLGQMEALWRESESYPNYEGRTGASPREILVVLFNAANSSRYAYVSPLAILDEIEELIKQVSVYEFLKQEPLPGGFHNYAKFVEQVRGRLVDLIDDDVRSALGLVEETEYTRVFERYISHVMHWTKKEKVANPTTGRAEDPDETLMREVETTLGVGTPADDFRHDMITRIGAWSLDNPSRKPNYADIFSEHFRRLRESYFDTRRKLVGKAVQDLLAYLAGDTGGLTDEERQRASDTADRLQSQFGYNPDSARDSASLVLKHRYSES